MQQECHQVPYGEDGVGKTRQLWTLSYAANAGDLNTLIDLHVGWPHPFTLNFDLLLIV